MKRHWWNGSMTLLVIRDADQAVKQVSVSKMLVVSVPDCGSHIDIWTLSGYAMEIYRTYSRASGTSNFPDYGLGRHREGQGRGYSSSEK